MIRQTQLRYYAEKPFSASGPGGPKSPEEKMLKTLHAPSHPKPLFPPHQKHRSMEYLPMVGKVSRSAEANLDFELCNINLGEPIYPEASPSSEDEGETDAVIIDEPQLQATAFRSTFSKTNRSTGGFWNGSREAKPFQT